MERFLTKLIFFIVFTFIFLGAGSYVANWIGIVLFVFLFIYYYSRLQWNLFDYKRIDFIAWVIFLGLSVVSFAFTKSIPASFEELTIYFFAFFLYYFFLLFPKKLFSIQDFAQVLLAIGLFLSLLSIINYSTIVNFNQSGVSLIDHYFGHNHLAALLLLIIPLGYYKAITSKRLLYRLVTVVLFISMVLTFGRVATLISVVQIILIDRYFSIKKSWKKNLIFFFLMFVIFFIMVSISFPELFFRNSCESYFSFKNVMCKSISDDGRTQYWIQALNGLKENIFFGTGPGTFFLTNEKFKQFLHLSTPYAHNAYLQFFSELGVVGGFAFIFLIFSIISVVKKKLKRNYVFPMFIGLVGLLINVFFDFDFSINSIFIFTFVYCAQLVKKSQNNVVNIVSLLKIRTIQIFMVLVGLFLLFGSVMFFGDRFIVKQNNIVFQKKVFLFNSFKSYYFQKYSYESLYPYFSQDYEFLVHFYKKDEVNNKEETFYKIREVSNMSKLFFHDFELFKELNKTDIYKKDILDSIDFLKAMETSTDSYFYSERRNLVGQFMLLYPQEDQKNFTNFFELVQIVNKEYPWLHYKTRYDLFSDYSKSCLLTSELQDNIGEPFGDQRIAVANIYLHCLAYCNRSFDSNGNTQCNLRDKIIKNYFEYTHNDRERLLQDLDEIIFKFHDDHVITDKESLFFLSTRSLIEKW